MTRAEVPLSLIGVPYVQGGHHASGADCGWIAARALDLCGIHVPLEALGVGGSDRERLRAYLEGGGHQWEHVGDDQGDATELGDVVESLTQDGGPHLSVLVDERARLVLTTDKGLGSFIVRASAISRVRAVYRWVGSRDEVPHAPAL